MPTARGADRVPVRVRGVRIGHAESADRRTGVTVTVFSRASAAVAEVRGGAPCTYDIGGLRVEATFGRRWAVFFSGGSGYGLDAARGIRTELRRRGLGGRSFANPNPLLPLSGAALFDLPRERADPPDYAPLGASAARSARAGTVRIGRVGAGVGASLGKYLGRQYATPGGVGYADGPVLGRFHVGALVVLNSVGAVRDPETGRWRAGAVDEDGRLRPPGGGARSRAATPGRERGTNLVLVVTDAPVGRATLARVVVQGQDGLARAVVPAHTATDGDVVFGVTTAPERRTPPSEPRPGYLADRLGTAAADCVVGAVLSAVAGAPPR